MNRELSKEEAFCMANLVGIGLTKMKGPELFEEQEICDVMYYIWNQLEVAANENRSVRIVIGD